jgi:hypothetical protein
MKPGIGNKLFAQIDIDLGVF